MDTKPNHYSLKRRLLIWVLLSISLLWSTAALWVYHKAGSEMSEIMEHVEEPHEDDKESVQHERDELIDLLLWNLIWPLLLGLPVLAGIVTVVIYRSNRSLVQLGEAMAQRPAMSFEPLETQHLPLEIVSVVDALNAWMQRAKSGVESEMRFTANAAHELRTPISAMRAQAQVAMMSQDEGQRKHALLQLIEGSDRAAHLTTQLLALARLDQDGVVQRSPSHFDLAVLVRQQMAMLEAKAENKQQVVELDAQGEFFIQADKLWVETLLRNVLDNAMRYAPVAAQIAVSLKMKNDVFETAHYCQLTIADSGPGISDENLERLGERFFRAEQRHATNPETGSGLGWSIIRQIAKHEDVIVRCTRSARLGGLEVNLIFTM